MLILQDRFFKKNPEWLHYICYKIAKCRNSLRALNQVELKGSIAQLCLYITIYLGPRNALNVHGAAAMLLKLSKFGPDPRWGNPHVPAFVLRLCQAPITSYYGHVHTEFCTLNSTSARVSHNRCKVETWQSFTPLKSQLWSQALCGQN